MVIAKPTTIAIIMAIAATAMYISVGGKICCGCGVAVGCDGSATKDVIECDGQYDSDPAKDA